uniref:Thaumatin-like protein n=1 Tax=Nicotiana tabacum TaxID=4097 RepID=A0A1S3YAI7_TOBAC|nr:PREDICTED: thaumatin-like protein [Nicotiana tabacum]
MISFFKSFFISLSVVTSLLFSTQAVTTIDIRNNCPFAVWAAALPGGGRRLDYGGKWTFQPLNGQRTKRIWGRTNCIFDASVRGQCQTGDCNGVLECHAFGTPPNTVAEYSLNQFDNLDFFDISLVDGFNVPMEFSPTSGNCSVRISCTTDIIGQCPNELRIPGGCNNPCTVFHTTEYCCTSGGNCGPTQYS